MHPDIADLIDHPKVLETFDHIHHSISKHDHMLRVVKHSQRLARYLKADERICVRAALIHDIDSRQGTLRNHGAIAARWAAAQGESVEVCTAIISHMYPIGGPLPRSREAWVLVFADKAASFGDAAQFIHGLFNGTSVATRRRLKQSDPFESLRPHRLRRLIIRRRKG